MIANDLVGMVSRGAARSSAELRPPSITYHHRLNPSAPQRLASSSRGSSSNSCCGCREANYDGVKFTPFKDVFIKFYMA